MGLRGHLLHLKPSRKDEKAGVRGGPDTAGAATRDCTAAMRARANGSLCTNCAGGDAPETGAGAGGGGLPRFDCPGERENGYDLSCVTG